MESGVVGSRGHAAKLIKGFKKAPTYEDILGVQLSSAKRMLHLPERYVHTALNIAEGSSNMIEQLEEQKGRTHAARRADNDDRDADMPQAVRHIRGERGETGETGQTGAQGPQGMQGVQGSPGAPGAPGASPNLEPVIREMERRLHESAAIRERAREQELQRELAHIQMESARHAETARVLAQASADLTSIPNELRAMAQAMHQRPDYLREAAQHLGAQAQRNHEQSMEYMRRNGADLASHMGRTGQGIASALERFKPPEGDSQIATTAPPPPPPPPPPAAGAVRQAARAIEKRGPYAPPAPKAQAPAGPPAPPPAGPPAPKAVRRNPGPPPPPGATPQPVPSRPGSSTDPVGYPHAPWRAGRTPAVPTPAPPQFYIGEPVKPRKKKKKEAGAPGTRTEPSADATTRLTKHGPKPIVRGSEPVNPEPTPHAPGSTVPKPRGTKRKGDYKPPDKGAKRKHPLHGAADPPAKRLRRVSAHAI